jgi:U3 small nucleolar RNA-associated protein 23
MQQYGMTFGFREPFQVLRTYPEYPVYLVGAATNPIVVDAGIIQDAARFKMDLVGGLKRTLHGEVKPSISPIPTSLSLMLTQRQ